MKGCDLLAISAAITAFLINKLNNDDISFLGDLFTAIGANLTLVANNQVSGQKAQVSDEV